MVRSPRFAMRRDLAYLVVILSLAFAVRVYAPWKAVFAGDRVDFLETDAWYHVRLIENQVRNWPWRVTVDPYVAPGGQFVPIAPLFDTITSTAVVVLHGRQADTARIERVAAFVAPVLGTLTIAALWGLARRVFERRAAIIGAALLAVLPGHFLDRTLVGFYDHHALEALLAITTLWLLAEALPPSQPGTSVPPGGDGGSRQGRRLLAGTEVVSGDGGSGRGRRWLVGVALALYLLGWSSGAFLVGILGLWLLLFIPLARSAAELSHAARVAGVAALTAFVLVFLFQDPRMFRYGSQMLSLIALAGIALAVTLTATRVVVSRPQKASIYGGIAIVAVAASGVVWWWSPSLITQVLVDLRRFTPDPQRMGVLEARPLFFYTGQWNWLQPWVFFRTGFFVGLIALVAFTGRVWRERRAIDLALWTFTAAAFAATIGQNRFGYYLVPASALLGGWLAVKILDWGGTPHAGDPMPRARRSLPLHRELAVVVVAGGMFAPNLVPAVLMASRSGSFPAYWRNTMEWLRRNTPPPFVHGAGAGEDYYYARYPDVAPPPDYSVMNWWDHGYWIVQAARRVPVANPTQERAPNAARFYTATDEREAAAILAVERSRFVLSDWELPFRLTADGTVMGRFQNVVSWAEAEHDKYYEVYYRRETGVWTPVWVFHEPYYRSMAYRLSVLGGTRGVPVDATAVVVVADRLDQSGFRFRELVSQTNYATYEAAVEAARAPADAGRAIVVGLDPWRPAFPVERLMALREVYQSRTRTQKPGEAPWVRVFELR